MTDPNTRLDPLRPRHPIRTIAGLYAAPLREHAAAVALAIPGRPGITYAELDRLIASIGRDLAERGVGRGSRIGIALPDGPSFVAVLLGVCFGATGAPLNDQLDEQTLLQLLVAMRLEALVVVEGAESPAVRAARRAGLTLLQLRAAPPERPTSLQLLGPPLARRVEQGPPQADDIALLMHTSGTTATPKIVPWEQWRIAETARNRIELARLERTDCCLLALPLHSSAGIRRVFPALLTGGSLLCPGPLAADDTLDLLAAAAVTQYFAPPAANIALLEAFERRSPRPRHRLRALWSGTADLPAAVRAKLESAFGVPVINGYGMTETGSITQTPFPPARAPAGSVGRATNIEIAIADEEGRHLGIGEAGEILVRGPEVFAGYESNDEANARSFRDGWFRTGDAGFVDRQGYVFLSGRLTEIINRGGRKISPYEVEEALTQHPQVIEAAAFAVAHPTQGQDLAAAVILRRPLGERELRRFLRLRLAAFKVPTRIIEVPSLPRAISGKVDRAALAELARGAIDERAEPPQGEIECSIARIFCEVLQLPSIGRHDNFFDLGGDSLRGMRVLSALGAAFAVTPTLETLFDHPTVAELAVAAFDPAAAQPASRGRPEIEIDEGSL